MRSSAGAQSALRSGSGQGRLVSVMTRSSSRRTDQNPTLKTVMQVQNAAVLSAVPRPPPPPDAGKGQERGKSKSRPKKTTPFPRPPPPGILVFIHERVGALGADE